jgi:hypothetical protein
MPTLGEAVHPCFARADCLYNFLLGGHEKMGGERLQRTRCLKTTRTVLLAVMAASATLWASQHSSATNSAQRPSKTLLAAWHFRADWAAGYSSWMSFPLPHDVGYDPSIYTEKRGDQTVLVRMFTSHGESRPGFGFVRPLQFHAGSRSSCDIEYELNASSEVADATLIFGAADGHHYAAVLPSSNGRHRLHITGDQLGLKAQTPIVVVVIKARLLKPAAGSNSTWILTKFDLNAERTPIVPLRAPSLRESSDGGQVMVKAIRSGEALHVAWQSSGTATHLALFDPSAKLAVEQNVPANATEAAVALPSSAAHGLWRAEVEQASARAEFHFFVLGSVPSHPRLLLTEQRLAQLRGPEYESARQQIHTRATHLATSIAYSVGAGDNIELMPSGPGIQPAYLDQIKPYFALMDSYSGAIAYNALDYRLNGNAEAFRAARRALLTMTKWRTWEPPRFRAHGLQTYYEVGVAAQLVALGYDLIADQLSAEEKATVEQAFWRQVIAPAVHEYFIADRDPIGASNFMANSLGGALAAAIAVAGDTPEWNQREGAVLGQLQFAFEGLLDGLFPGDGSEAEPTGYENFAMQGLSWGMSALHALGVTPRGADRMASAFWWPYYDTVVPGMQLDTGDFNGHLIKLPGFAWGGEYFGIPELRAYYDSAARPDLSQGARFANNGHFLEEMPGPLDLVCCSAVAKPFPQPPASRVFPARGSAALRSGWGPEDTVISLRVGPWFNHHHNDEGAFQVATHGVSLIDEAGYGRYYADPRYSNYFSQAPGHNTVIVDGDAFSQQDINGRYWPGFVHPSFTSTLLAHGFDYLNADLTSAYDGKLASFHREYFFVKPGLLVIRDRVKADQTHVFSWLLHISPGSTLTSNGPGASIGAKNAAAEVLALGANTKWTIESTPLSIALFDQLDKDTIPPHQELVLTSPKVQAAQFLVGMNFGATAETPSLKLTQWSEASGIGLRTAGERPVTMIFQTGEGPLHISNLSTDGSALIQGATSDSGWIAIAAHVVHKGGRELVRADTPVDIVMEHEGKTLNVSVHSAAATFLHLYRALAPAHVTVNSQPVRTEYMNNMIVLPLSSPGEHHVTID